MKSKKVKNPKLIIDRKVSWKRIIWFVALTYLITIALGLYIYQEGKKLDPEYPAIKHFLEITKGEEDAVARYLEVHPEVSESDLPTMVPGAGGQFIELQSLEQRVAVYVSQKHLAIQSFGLMMLFPALIAIILRLVFKDGFRNSGFRLGKFKNYLYMLAIIVVFVILSILANSLLFGRSPDWNLNYMTTGTTNILGNDASPFAFWAFQFIVIGLIANITFPIIMMLGEEYGWRSYLFQKLLPLGFWKANLITGAIWGLWHAPVILMGYNYGNYTLIGVLMFTLVGMLLGTIFNYMYARSNSVILAAAGHGWFNGMVPSVLLLTGFMGKETIIAPLGIIGLALMLIIVFVVGKLTKGYDLTPYVEMREADNE